jgi:CelD/BcsL family acetyltransferase involved in cellulose biosynthesis
LQVEASGWKGLQGRGSAILLDTHLAAFYRQLLDSFGKDGRCQIDLLKIDGQVAAGQFGIIAGRVLYLLKIGYDQRFSRVSPGQTLLEHTLSRLHAQGEIDRINLITNMKWHERWRPAQLKVYEARSYDRSLQGTLAYANTRLRARMGSWRRSLKAALKRRMA